MEPLTESLPKPQESGPVSKQALPPSSEQMQAALHQAKRMFEELNKAQAKLAPHIKALEFIERELQRAYHLAQVQIENKEHDDAHASHLHTMQDRFYNSIRDFQQVIIESSASSV